LEKQTFAEARERIKSGEVSTRTLTEDFLKQIEARGELNAFITVFEREALARADEVDKKIKSGTAGRLAGMVIAVKDIICIRGTRVTCGSRILEDYESPYDATVIEKLRDADAVVIGKTNLDEFAMGSSNENSCFGPVRNPHDPERVPGGSSGGSAVAVAANMAMTALGTDTGGSIRQPAALTGVVGLKPTYGRVSRYGLVAFACSLDQIGPIGHSVSDVADLLGVISGHDARDTTSAPVPVPDFRAAIGGEVRGIRVGVPTAYFPQGLDTDVRQAVVAGIDCLRSSGADLVELEMPYSDYAIAAYYVIATAEASSNLARYDGARFGWRDEGATDLQEMYLSSRSHGFGAEVKRRVMLGTYVLSSGYYEAYYRKAQRVRTLIKRDFDRAFESCDVLVTPTSPTTAFKLGEKLADPLTMYLSDIFTVSVNLAGLPAISIPCGFDSKRLPIGLQVVGRPFDEEQVLHVADFLERAGLYSTPVQPS
jgi:aspartyl-tRNA(Asn)/glutamyl-tRNA(Gln) amidotransferase subunit A